MGKVKKLTSESICTRIDRIVDNMDLPCDASDALGLVSKIVDDYQVWKKANKVFVKKNVAAVADCEQSFKDIVDYYQHVREEIATSATRDADCAYGGRIWDMVQEINVQLVNLQERAGSLLGRAEAFARAATPEK